MDPQQMQHTEKLIGEMLYFLESSSEDEEDDLSIDEAPKVDLASRHDFEKNGKVLEEIFMQPDLYMHQQQRETSSLGKEHKFLTEYSLWNTKELFTTNRPTLPSPICAIQEPIWPREHFSTFKLNDVASTPCFGNNVIELKEKSKLADIVEQKKAKKAAFPIWNTREIVNNKKTIYSTTPTLIDIEEPVCKSETDSNLDKLAESPKNGIIGQSDNSKNVSNDQLDENKDDADNIFVKEVQRSVYGNTQGHPINASSDYFEAAQDYAVYGDYFLDFPENLQDIMNSSSGSNSSIENQNESTDQYKASQLIQEEKSAESHENVFEKTSSTVESSITNNTVSTATTVSAVTSSTASYYQLCNGLQQRPGSSNSASCGMFLGNKVTYMATAAATTKLVYNQQTGTQANFVSNSLANAALGTSPSILYSNPMINAATQQYINAFFKETRSLNSVGNANPSLATLTAYYERIFYTQMLQQHIYNQNQQALAAMMHHKQMVNAAAVAMAAAAAATTVPVRQTTSLTTNQSNQGNALQTSPASVNALSSTSVAFPPLSQCGRLANVLTNGDIVARKQGKTAANPSQALTINGCDKPISASNE